MSKKQQIELEKLRIRRRDRVIRIIKQSGKVFQESKAATLGLMVLFFASIGLFVTLGVIWGFIDRGGR